MSAEDPSPDWERLFREAPLGVLRSTPDGRILSANPALVRLLGYEDEADVLRLELPRDVCVRREEYAELVERAEEGPFSELLARWQRSDGREILVRLGGHAVDVGDGRVVAIEAFVEDVTERVESERALERVLSSSGAILFRLAVLENGGYEPRWASDSVKELLGYDVDERLDPEWWVSGLHPDDREAALAASFRVLDEHDVVHEYRFRAKDGSYRWFREELHLLRDADGRAKEVVGVGTDVTREKERELALRRSEERFRELAAAAPDGILTLDRAGRVDFVNPAAERITGHRADELVGRPFTVLFPDRFRRANRRVFQEMMEEGEPAVLHARPLTGLRREGGEFSAEVSLAVRPERAGSALTAIVRDVKERREPEAERSVLRGELEALLEAGATGRRVLPVCAGCKDVRGDDGSWRPMESFLREHVPVEVSHGICPECIERLYGSLGEAGGGTSESPR